MAASILLVDDDPIITSSLERVLRPDGYNLVSVNDAETALALMEKQSFQMVISDQRMPIMKGSAFLSEVKKRYPDTARILLSGYCDFSALTDAVNGAGIHRFLQKPWVNADLRVEVGAIVKQVEQLREQCIPAQTFQENNIQADPILESEINQALSDQQLLHYFQPIINTQNNNAYAAEMLIRWNHPTRGLLTAAEFIPSFEGTKIMQRIGLVQLQYLLGRKKNLLRTTKICMNISPAQLSDAKYCQRLETFCSSLGLSAKNLVLEITETELMKSLTKTSFLLSKLKESGVRIALDDFCTGFSSLDCLRALPVDIIKIDKSFVDKVTTNDRSKFIITSLVNLANKLNIEVIAEGVEKMQQSEVLKELGCYKQQGFLYGKPMIDYLFEKKQEQVQKTAL